MRRGFWVVVLLLFAGPTSTFAQTQNGVTSVRLKTPANADVGTPTNPLPVVPLAPGPLVSGVITSAMTGTTSTSLVSATTGSFLYITACQFSNDHASTDTTMLLQDGSGGTTLWKGNVPHGGGSNVVFASPLKVPTVSNALFAANVTTSSSTYAACQGFRSATSY